MHLISSGWFNGSNPAEVLEINNVKNNYFIIITLF
jgi:hypothetical protein